VPKNTKGNRRSNNNNPEGYNQFSSSWMDTARERPVAAAGLAAAAVGASVFLWSRRSQISEQISNLSDQIGEWNENMSSRGGSSDDFEMAGSESSFSSGSSGSRSTGSSSQFGGAMSGSGASGSAGSGMSGGTGLGSTTGASASGGRKGGASGKSGS
jgi:hypothetical protein